MNTPWPFPTSMPGSILDMPKADAQFQPTLCHFIKPNSNRGGMTVAYARTTDTRSGCMVFTAFAHCSDQDVFSKKVGVAVARENYENGNGVLLPLRKDNCDDSIYSSIVQVMRALGYVPIANRSYCGGIY